jgi:hypothetical protein
MYGQTSDKPDPDQHPLLPAERGQLVEELSERNHAPDPFAMRFLGFQIAAPLTPQITSKPQGLG